MKVHIYEVERYILKLDIDDDFGFQSAESLFDELHNVPDDLVTEYVEVMDKIKQVNEKLRKILERK